MVLDLNGKVNRIVVELKVTLFPQFYLDNCNLLTTRCKKKYSEEMWFLLFVV